MMFPVILVFVLGAGAVFAVHAAITHLPADMFEGVTEVR